MRHLVLFIVAIVAFGCSSHNYIYVTSSEDKVTVVDVDSRQIVSVLPAKGGPWGVAMSQDGGYAYLANFWKCKISTIDTRKSAVVYEMQVRYPWSVGVKPKTSNR